ncbi:hypothetical protein GCM10019059_16060 [Camelimonas fluminis]|nr:hypothetical protein GCM10019059_16060 [Camelimonas fluminis]
MPKNLPALLRQNALGLQMGAGARRRQIVNHFSVKFGNDLKIRRAGFDRARTPPERHRWRTGSWLFTGSGTVSGAPDFPNGQRAP